MCVLVQIHEGQEAGPSFQVERLVGILVSPGVDGNQDQKAEEVAEARKARRIEEVVHIECVVEEGPPKGSA